ncbi:MAG TPA: hypothetical protein VH351_06980 [Bryobacteraceae bacterium]|jgi:hypothetical protein|nr:hypothetical protein [Bryobacteraceae bacterium]
MDDPSAEYQRRRTIAETAEHLLERRFRLLGNLRLLLAIGTLFILWIALSQHLVSPWLALLPVVAFVLVAIWHQLIIRRRNAARRAAAYYKEGLERLRDNWSGSGATGENFRQPDHVFADDLDVFGRASLFQFVSRARTAFGERTLAEWLLDPAPVDVVLARHEAVRELTSALDLREDIALLGETVGTSVHAASLAEWANAPAISLPRIVRPLGLALAVLNIAGLFAFFRYGIPLFPFLIFFLCNVGLIFATRHAVGRILGSIETPAHDLDILALLVERLERESFAAPRLRQLHRDLQTEGLPASRRIARLRRLIELLDSSDHVIVRVINPLILFKQQVAVSVESWRRANGQHVARWLAATAELEALSSLACLAYERPSWSFPTLLDQPAARFAAEGLAHPLIPQSRAVPNDVSLGGTTLLLIVSGSNMSGKSTLLRSIGLNALLAWAGAPVCAKSLTLSPIRLGASIRVTDSLQDNRSRFFAEITRLRNVVDLTKTGPPVLFLLDELLSGTNSHDRKVGAAAVVRGLIRDGAFGLITTHDLALAEIADELSGRALNVHFEDRIAGDQIEFDYRLRPGIVTHSNALALMRAVGLEI